MAPRTASAPSRAASFVCTSCLRNVRLSGPRFLSAASSSATRASAPKAGLRYAGGQTSASRAAATSAQPPKACRPYSTAAAAQSVPPPVNRGCAHLPHRRLVSLSGPDAAKFLQGLVTNNVDPARHASFYAAFLDARGRVLWDVFVWVYPELAGKEWACYIEVDADEMDALLKHLKRHKLRSKIKVEPVKEGELAVWASWGLTQDQLQQDEALVASLEDPRGPGFGIRCLFGGDGKTKGHVPVVDAVQYRLRRYLYGIPEGPQEIARESALPMECNIDLSSGIDFKKGCYVGQELTIRTKHTGVVRKRILPVQLYHAQAPDQDSAKQAAVESTFFLDPTWREPMPDSGSDIKQLDDQGGIKKGRAAGKFVAGIGNIGLGLCRLEMMTSMKISAEGGGWKPGVEFGIRKPDAAENEKPVRVRAIVPQWFRERERQLWDKGRTRV